VTSFVFLVLPSLGTMKKAWHIVIIQYFGTAIS